MEWSMVHHRLRHGPCASHGMVHGTVHGLVVGAMQHTMGQHIPMGWPMGHVIVDRGRTRAGR